MSDVTDPKPRRHPDIFTPDEATEYLHLESGDAGKQTLKNLRDKGILTGYYLGPTLMYHRRDLDVAVGQIFTVTTQVKTRQSKQEPPLPHGVRPPSFRPRSALSHGWLCIASNASPATPTAPRLRAANFDAPHIILAANVSL